MTLTRWLPWIALAVGCHPSPAFAQEPKPTLYIFADTAGVAAIGDSTYLTWIFAKASPTALPSSGVLVGFDRKQRKVQRFAHVVYHLGVDSSGVTGNIVADSTGWVPVSNPRLFALVCEVGPTHGAWQEAFPQVITPKAVRPVSPYSDS